MSEAGKEVADTVHAFLARTRGGPSDAPARGPLSGIAVAVKDNLCTLDLPTTCGSRLLEGYISPFEATAVRRVREAGGWIAGKTNMDEFAMGSSTEHSAFGPTLNPHARDRSPGGSSGGSAAAVAAGLVRVALGSDTGGSVRQPAAFCGVVGIKPTFGRVSRYGLVAFASSLDHVGTIGRSVAEAATLLEVVAGHDLRDATSSSRPVPELTRAALADSPVGWTIGIPQEFFGDELDPGVRSCSERAIQELRSLGARIRPVSLPHTGAAHPTYCILAPAEAASNLARFDGVRFGMRARGADSAAALIEATRTGGFGAEVVRRIVLGTWVLGAGYRDRYYARAQRARTLVARDFDRVWDAGVDLLFTPTTPTPPFPLGERTGDPVAMYRSDLYTVSANLAGIPALSLPIGEADGLPVGGQLMAPRWKEARMIALAGALERRLRSEGVWLTGGGG